MQQYSATWQGTLQFGDKCDSGSNYVCVTADTSPPGRCVTTSALASAAITLQGCRATMAFEYERQSGECIGTAFPDLVFVDYTGIPVTIPVVAVAAHGTIVFQGRYAGVGEDAGAYSVVGTMVPACGQSGSWWGTLTYVD